MTTPDELDPITGEAPLDPDLLDEREPAPEEAAPSPIPLLAPPGQPEADQGISDGTQVCTVCRQMVAAGETYVQTAVRGINHLEPCSHRA